MNELDAKTDFTYKNKWLGLAATSEAGRLTKTLQTSFVSYHDIWTKELSLLRAFDHLAVVQPIDTVPPTTADRSYHLPRGTSLQQVILEDTITVAERLKIAENLIRIVLDFHSRKLFFCDLTWNLFWYDLLEEKLYLLDAIMCIPTANISEYYKLSVDIESDMYCCSPEQTFQTAHLPDKRSNYYSLGIILYALFTGQRPFKGEERISILHKHLSVLPAVPHELKSTIGQHLSDFILKLIAKHPKDRYQSAKGLKWDFEQIKDQLLNKKSDPDFTLGSCDFPSTFQLPDHLFFRPEEQSMLLEQAASVQQGKKTVVLLKGNSGVGIGQMMEDALLELADTAYYSGKGEYLMEGQIPYQGIKTATAHIIHQMTRKERAEIKPQLEERLHNLSGVLTTFLKDFDQLFTSNTPFQELSGTASFHRFSYAFTEFLNILEAQEKSIVLCLDQVHLAGYGSLQLLEQLLKTSSLNRLLLILGFEEDQTKWSISFHTFHKQLAHSFGLSDSFRKIEHQINNFSREALDTMLQQLKIEPRQAFGTILFDETKGNPQFIRQFLEELTLRNLISANSQEQRWEIQMKAVNDIHISEDIDNFLSERLKSLEDEESNLLKIAATIGQQFKVRRLYRVLPYQESEKDKWIDQLRAKGFFVPISYRQAKLYELAFAHTAFPKVIQETISAEEYEAIKLTLAEDLAKRIQLDENDIRLYELMGHLLPIAPKKCEQYQQYILRAAEKAKRESAFENASLYFEKLVEIGRIDINKNKGAIFQYAYNACECALFDYNYQRYEALLARLPQLAATKLQSYQVYQLKALAYMQLEEFEKVIDNMIVGVRDMGLKFEDKLTTFDQIKIFFKNLWKARNINENSILQYPIYDKAHLSPYHDLLSVSAAAVYLVNPSLSSRVVEIRLNDLTKNGLTPSAATTIMSLALAVNSFSNLVKVADRLALAALKLLEQKTTNSNVSMGVNFMYGSFVQHISQPLVNCIDLLQDSYRKGREIGNTHNSFHCLGLNRWYLFFSGTALQKVKEALEASQIISIDANQTTTIHYHYTINSIITELQQGYFNEKPLSHPDLPIHLIDLEKADNTTYINYFLAQMIITTANGKLFDQTKGFEAIVTFLKDAGHGTYNAIVHAFYMLYHTFKSGKFANVVSRKAANKYLKIIEVRAEVAPFNYATKYFLLKALQAEQLKKIKSAGEWYQKAYEAAIEYDNYWDRGLVTENMGYFLQHLGKEKLALKKMEEAITAYQLWGASSIVNRLQQEFPALKISSNTLKRNETTEAGQQITASALQEVFRFSKLMIEEKKLEEQVQLLLTTVENIVGTQRSVFLMNVEDDWRVYGEKWRDQSAQILNSSMDVSTLPISLIKVVQRRGKTLMLQHATQDHQFAKDAYIDLVGVKSILCIPFVKSGTVKNILYLENRLLEGVFDQEKMNFLEALCTQVSIALEHTTLTETLEEKLELRSKQVQLERDKSDELLRNILPQKIAQELKETGKVKARKHDHVSVLFTDFKDFSQYSSRLDADQIIGDLDECYRAFDKIVEDYGLEKIKTIGDSYMCASGIPEQQDHQELNIVKAGLEMIDFIEQFNISRQEAGLPIMKIRAGIHTGAVIAGVVGFKKYAYDIWGPTVNIASRMESSGQAGKLNISGSTYLKVKDHYECEYRGKIEAKNVGEIDMYFVKDG